MRSNLIIIAMLILSGIHLSAQKTGDFNGLHMNMSNLSRLSNAESRSISPENLTGEKGKGGMTELKDGSAKYAARELGKTYKVNPYVIIKPGETFTMADIEGEGAIQHIWMTPTGVNRLTILRFYWDDEAEPSVEVPVGDFFASAWEMGNEPEINSLAVCVSPLNGFNCYWQMPFRKNCRVTMENKSKNDVILYYQIDYVLTDIPDDVAYFHARFSRVKKMTAKEDFVILDQVKGNGHYVGTYLAHGANSPGWWGEGEVKFFLDGDGEFPTICGTGEEDYFCGSYGYEMNTDGKGNETYNSYSTPYAGFYHVIDPANRTGQRRFGEYRWHITDPIRFKTDIRVTIQGLGWKKNGAYLPLEDDMATVAYWYQTEPHQAFPPLPEVEDLLIVNSLPVDHLAKDKKVMLTTKPSPKYNNDGSSLTDGLQGSGKFNDGNWMGFNGKDMELTIDLEKNYKNKTLKIYFLSDQNSWIFPPTMVELFTSIDGKDFEKTGQFIFEDIPSDISLDEIEFKIKNKFRYLKIVAKNRGVCPPWHKGAPGKAWIFVDEIIVQ